jgi:hypothetical protein
MGTPFPNPVVGGGGALVVPLIRSPNFSLEDQTGWAIYANGDAYFFNVTAAGAVTATSVVVSGAGDGIFLYDGTPAYGNLLLAASSMSGDDQFGNPYTGPGISLSIPGSEPNSIQLRPDLGALLVYAT